MNLSDGSHLSSIDEEWPADFVILESAYKEERKRIQAENIFLRHSLWEISKIVDGMKSKVEKANRTVEQIDALRAEVAKHKRAVADVREIMSKEGWLLAVKSLLRRPAKKTK